MNNDVLSQHNHIVDRAVYLALLGCYIIFTIVNLVGKSGVLTIAAFLAAILVLLVVNTGKLKEFIRFKSFVYITSTAILQVFIFCQEGH
ncbi:MAG: hypothetical protein WBJ07_04330, partial [Limnochordia bacterium]